MLVSGSDTTRDDGLQFQLYRLHIAVYIMYCIQMQWVHFVFWIVFVFDGDMHYFTQFVALNWDKIIIFSHVIYSRFMVFNVVSLEQDCMWRHSEICKSLKVLIEEETFLIFLLSSLLSILHCCRSTCKVSLRTQIQVWIDKFKYVLSFEKCICLSTLIQTSIQSLIMQ